MIDELSARERMPSGDTYLDVGRSALKVIRFAQLAAGEQDDNIDYGITVAPADWTIKRLLQCPDFRVVLYREALWDHHQDVAAVVKRPLRASS